MRLRLIRNATLHVWLAGKCLLVDPMLDPAGARPPVEDTVGIGDRIAVGIDRGAPQHFIDPFDQPIRHRVFEMLGVFVHVRPAHAHHFHEEEFDQPMPPHDQRREPFTALPIPGTRTSTSRSAPTRNSHGASRCHAFIGI